MTVIDEFKWDKGKYRAVGSCWIKPHIYCTVLQMKIFDITKCKRDHMMPGGVNRGQDHTIDPEEHTAAITEEAALMSVSSSCPLD